LRKRKPISVWILSFRALLHQLFTHKQGKLHALLLFGLCGGIDSQPQTEMR
jgi:hypothetical protein